MERPLDQSRRPKTTPRENDVINCSAVVASASPITASATPKPQEGSPPADPTTGLRSRTTIWSVGCAGCHAADLPWVARRPWPAWRVGAGWSRGATRAGCPGRFAACWSSTSNWLGGCSARRACRRNFRAPRPGCLASTARSEWTRTSIRPSGGFRSSGRPASDSPRSFTLDQIRPFPGPR